MLEVGCKSSEMKTSEETSPYFPAWVSSTAEDFQMALNAIEARDFEQLADLSEASCLKMHGVMQSSQPPMIYWRPATLACIHAVRELRASGVPVFFTIDAGPQVKAVCLPEALDRFFVRWLDDRGLAPERVLSMHTLEIATPAHLERARCW